MIDLWGRRENRLCCGSHSLFSLFNFVPHQHPSIDVCFSITPFTPHQLSTHAQTRPSIPGKSPGYHYQRPSIGKLTLAISRMEHMLLARPMVLLTLVRLSLLVLPLKLPRLPRRLEHYRICWGSTLLTVKRYQVFLIWTLLLITRFSRSLVKILLSKVVPLVFLP